MFASDLVFWVLPYFIFKFTVTAGHCAVVYTQKFGPGRANDDRKSSTKRKALQPSLATEPCNPALHPKYFPSDWITLRSQLATLLQHDRSATLMRRHGKANCVVKGTWNIHLCYNEEEKRGSRELLCSYRLCGLSFMGGIGEGYCKPTRPAGVSRGMWCGYGVTPALLRVGNRSLKQLAENHLLC